MLSRIYTRTGDDGSTALGDISRVPKTDPRLAAYADVDEANCAIGMALALAACLRARSSYCPASRTNCSMSVPICATR